MDKNKRKQIAQSIERDVKNRWGWKISFTVESNGSFHWRNISRCDRYDMYPGMTKQQADNAVITEIQQIINRYMPTSQITYYEQSGQMHYR